MFRPLVKIHLQKLGVVHRGGPWTGGPCFVYVAGNFLFQVIFVFPLLRVVQYSQIDSIGVSGDKNGLHWYQWYDWYQ